MFIARVGDKFIATSMYKEKDILKNAGFWWDAKQKSWWTRSLEAVSNVKEHLNQEMAEELEAEMSQQENKVEASRATSSDIVIPAPEGKDYFPFQKAGIEFIFNKKNSLLSDDMGLGKTCQAIGLVNLDASIRRVLIVCPASLKINWKNELEAWLVEPMSIEIAKTKQPFPTSSDIVIINYDILERFTDEIRTTEWDLLVCDEAHFIKGGTKTRRGQQVVGKRVKHSRRDQDRWEITPIPARKKVFLTGTPIVNRPAELWPLISTLDPQGWNDYDHFARRYCDAKRGRWGWEAKGANNLEELQLKLRTSLMIRRLKKDVLKDLPPKMRQIVPLPQNGARKVIEAELRAFEQYKAAVYELRIASELLAASDNKTDYEESVSRLSQGVAVSFGELATTRKATAIAKVPYVLEFLEGTSEQTVIFAHHKEVIRQLKEALGSEAVVLDGSTSMTKRNKAVESFQNDPNIKYFIGSIQAAGVGLTLTASSHIIFAELDWTPAAMSQAEDRAYRIGQKNSVLVQHLVFDESVDANIAKTIIAKQTIIDQALDNTIDGQENVVVGDEIPVFVSEISDNGGCATSGSSFNQIEKEAKDIAPQTVTAVHSALRYLANLCDGAKSQDGAGFNSYDAEIGVQLAQQDALTQKQAALGRKILRKYSRQLGPEMMAFISD